MSYDIIAGNWNYYKGKLKSQWNDLTDDEIGELEGNYTSLLGFLQKKYGLAKNKAEKEINDFIENNFSDNFLKKAEKVWNNSCETIKEKSADFQESASELLKNHPMKVLGVTLVAGLIISRILKD